MLTRRHFLYALTGGALTLAGCKGKPTATGDSSTTVPVTTVIDPKAAAAAPLLTRHPIRFTDVSGPAGLTWRYANGATGKHHFIENTGGGVAFFDYNNDGLLDIFALQGGPVPGARRRDGTSPPAASCTTTTATARSPTSRPGPAWTLTWATGRASPSPTTTTTAGPTCTSQATAATTCSTTTATARSPT